MIFDNISNVNLYKGMSFKFDVAFDYLINTDLFNLPCGKYEILGDEVFAIVQEYMTKESGDLEAHKVYADVQFIIKGEEKIGFSKLLDVDSEKIPYNKEKDISFFSGNYADLFLKQGDFAVFFPQDAHAPSLAMHDSCYVKKVVIKIKL